MSKNFTYNVGDESITLPSLKNLSMGVARKTRGLSLVESVCVMVEEFLTDDELAVFDKIPQSELSDFVRAWRESSGIALGESTAS